jgi:hypothetical protein
MASAHAWASGRRSPIPAVTREGMALPQLLDRWLDEQMLGQPGSQAALNLTSLTRSPRLRACPAPTPYAAG